MPAAHRPEIGAIEFSPNEKLYFSGPFHEISKTSITLKNLTVKNAFFKIKTTEPKKYCVRPNMGCINPQDTLKVTVILQPGDDTILTTQGQHKFLIQYSITDSNDPTSLLAPEQFWHSSPSESIFHHKMKCFFETPEQALLRKQTEKMETKVDNLKDAAKLINEFKTQVDDLKRQNSKLNLIVSETRKRLELAQKPSQFPNILFYTVVALLGWLFAKFVL